MKTSERVEGMRLVRQCQHERDCVDLEIDALNRYADALDDLVALGWHQACAPRVKASVRRRRSVLHDEVAAYLDAVPSAASVPQLDSGGGVAV